MATNHSILYRFAVAFFVTNVLAFALQRQNQGFYKSYGEIGFAIATSAIYDSIECIFRLANSLPQVLRQIWHQCVFLLTELF